MTRYEFERRIDCYVDIDEGTRWEQNGLKTLSETLSDFGLRLYDQLPECPDKVLALRLFEDLASRAYKALRFGSI